MSRMTLNEKIGQMTLVENHSIASKDITSMTIGAILSGGDGNPSDTLVEKIGRATAEEMAAVGIRWNFAPVVAVPQDIHWGRTYEGFGEQTDLVSAMGVAFDKGQQ